MGREGLKATYRDERVATLQLVPHVSVRLMVGSLNAGVCPRKDITQHATHVEHLHLRAVKGDGTKRRMAL